MKKIGNDWLLEEAAANANVEIQKKRLLENLKRYVLPLFMLASLLIVAISATSLSSHYKQNEASGVITVYRNQTSMPLYQVPKRDNCTLFTYDSSWKDFWFDAKLHGWPAAVGKCCVGRHPYTDCGCVVVACGSFEKYNYHYSVVEIMNIVSIVVAAILFLTSAFTLMCICEIDSKVASSFQ